MKSAPISWHGLVLFGIECAVEVNAMRRTVAGFWWSPTIEGTPALVVTAAFFILGVLIGCLTAFRINTDGTEALCAYLERFLSMAREGELVLPQFPALLWRTLRWPLAAFLLSFTALGLLGIPLLSALRGFFLAFSVASFARVYGHDGLTVAFLLQGIPGLLSVPAFFLLSTQSLSAAYTLAGRGSGQGRRDLPYGRDYFLRCGLCAGVFFASLLVECYLVPILVTGWAGALLQ